MPGLVEGGGPWRPAGVNERHGRKLFSHQQTMLGLTALLGDPLEDLGWLCMNAWRFGVIEKPVGGFGDRQALYDEYARASGHPVDPERVRFWEVFGALKWGLVCQWFARQFTSGEVRSIERAAIGRRVSEVEMDLLDLIEGIE